jgi:hypothetical protein
MMAKKDDVHLVKSIGSVGFPSGGQIDGTPLTSDLQNEYMHGSISVNYVVVVSILLLQLHILLRLKYNKL